MAGKMDKGKTSQQGMEESGTEQISPQVNQMVELTRKFQGPGAWTNGRWHNTLTPKKYSWKTREVGGFHFECVEHLANKGTSSWQGNRCPLHKDSSQVGQVEETPRKRRIKP